MYLLCRNNKLIHKIIRFYLNLDLRYLHNGMIISPVHGRTGFAIGSKGGGSSGFLQLALNWARGWTEGRLRPDGRRAWYRGRLLLRKRFRKKLALTGRSSPGGGRHPAAKQVFPGPRVSPRAGGPRRGFRRKGPGSRRFMAGATPWCVVLLRRKGNLSSGLSGRRLSGRGQPRGSGETRTSKGNGKCRNGGCKSLRWVPPPLRGRRTLQQVSLLSLGVR